MSQDRNPLSLMQFDLFSRLAYFHKTNEVPFCFEA